MPILDHVSVTLIAIKGTKGPLLSSQRKLLNEGLQHVVYDHQQLKCLEFMNKI